MTDKRFGVGSLEEEIRKVRDVALGKAEPEPEPVVMTEEQIQQGLEEGDVYGSFKTTDAVRTKKSKHNQMGGKAQVFMKIAKGKLEFTVKHDNGRTEVVDAKGLAKIVA